MGLKTPIPEPLEVSHPELAEIFLQVANKEHPLWSGISISKKRVSVKLRPELTLTLSRKQPCFCGSGKKSKHCHPISIGNNGWYWFDK